MPNPSNLHQPTLFVIAGPNGAGKSTLSQELLSPFGLLAFDWDQVFHQKWSLFSFDPAVKDGVREAANRAFEEEVETALSQRSSFAFETNFHTPVVLQVIDRFRKAGFQVVLYFLYLTHAEIAKQRVQKRVEHGGHFVSESTIEFRHQEGLTLLNQHFSEFDGLVVYNTGLDHDLRPMLTLEQGQVLEAFVSAKDLHDQLPTLAGLL